jgi:hypothetical protein
MPHAPPVAGPESIEAFAKQVEGVLSRARAAAGELIHTAPSPIERATDLQRALDVAPALAWQLFRLATAPDAFSALEFLPRAGSMARLLGAAREHGFAIASIDTLAEVYEEFQALVRHHAGDRDTFDAMAAPLGGVSGQIEQKHRRAVFRGNVQVWGFQASTLYRACILHQSATPGREAASLIAGFVSLRQLRPQSPIPLMRRRIVLEAHGELKEVKVTGPTVLEDFSTTGQGSIVRVSADGVEGDTLILNGVGRAASQTCFLSETVGEAPARNGAPFSMGLLVSVPCETLLIDLLVQRGWSTPEEVAVGTYGNPSNVESAMTGSEQYLMPARETAAYLGTSLDALHAPEVARCPALIGHVLKRNGWDRTEFDIYRCRVRYPILHTAVSLHVPVAG